MYIKIIIICLVLVCFWYYLFLKKKKELKRISVELNISVEQINKICESILQEFKKYDARVICNWGGFDTTETLNACSRLRFSKRIDIKSTWIKKNIRKLHFYIQSDMNSGIKIKNLFFQFFILRRGDLETGLESVELIFTGCNLFKKNMRLLETKC